MVSKRNRVYPGIQTQTQRHRRGQRAGEATLHGSTSSERFRWTQTAAAVEVEIDRNVSARNSLQTEGDGLGWGGTCNSRLR